MTFGFTSLNFSSWPTYLTCRLCVCEGIECQLIQKKRNPAKYNCKERTLTTPRPATPTGKVQLALQSDWLENRDGYPSVNESC